MSSDKDLAKCMFDGKRSSYSNWSERFLSYASIKGCDQALTRDYADDKIVDDDATLDPTSTTDLEKERIRKENRLAYSLLMMNQNDDMTRNAYRAAKTTKRNCARTAWLNLKKIHQPQDDATKYELVNKFNRLELRYDTKNPDEWFSELEIIRAQLNIDYNHTISDDEVVSQILYNVQPTMYQTLFTIIKRDINHKKAIDLNDFKRDIRQIYQQHNMGRDVNKKDKELALVTFSNGKPKFKNVFKGDCLFCGAKGHKAADCWDNEKNKDKRPPNYKVKVHNNASPRPTTPKFENKDSKLKCTYCHKDGHTIDHCYRKKRNEKKRASETAELMMIAIDGKAGDNFHQQMALFHKEGKENDHAIRMKYNISKDTFIFDSGATSHMRYSTEGMTNLKPWKVPIKVGNAQDIYSEMIGTYKGWVIQHGSNKSFPITLEDVLYIPKLYINLFSMTKVLNNPDIDIMKCNNTVALIINKRQHLIFNRTIMIGKGRLLGVDIPPLRENVHAAVDYTKLHGRLGHPHHAKLQSTAQKFGLKYNGDPKPCSDCTKAKIRIKNIPKERTDKPAHAIGIRIMFDISSVQVSSHAGNKFWLLIMDEFSKYCWSFFLKYKSDLPTTMLNWTKEFQRDYRKHIQFFRCDNSGENRTFREDLKTNLTNQIKFEMTAPKTPQQNGIIERKFATLYGKVRSMLNAANLTNNLRYALWAHAAKLATQLETILLNDKQTSPALILNGKNPSWINNLRTFGEVGIVHTSNPIKNKLQNRGTACLFLGYAEDHSGNVFKFYNVQTRGCLLSRNVVWMNKCYGEYFGNLTREGSSTNQLIDVDFADVPDSPPSNQVARIMTRMQTRFQEPPDDPIVTDPGTDTDGPVHTDTEDTDNEDHFHPATPPEVDYSWTRQPRHRLSGVNRTVHDLTTSYNPDPLSHNSTPDTIPDPPPTPSPPASPNDHDSDMVLHALATEITTNNLLEDHFAATAMDTSSIPCPTFCPKTYREAMTLKDRLQWQIALKHELRNCESRRVWTIIKKCNVPKGRKIIGNRWVFARKDDGRYRARTVAQGYSQIPGKDFQENHAPVIHDTTFHFILIMMLIHGLHSAQFDIETAFLYGNLDEEIYMEFPDGYEEYLKLEKGVNYSPNEYCVLLLMALYGLVQAARQWYKKITSIFAKLHFFPSAADPCLFIRKTDNQLPAFIILYVDDGAIIGSESLIKEVMTALSEELKVKSLGPLKNFVGCHLIRSKDGKTMYIHQPKLLQHLEDSFGQYCKGNKYYLTPAAPKTVIVRPEDDMPLLSATSQTQYRSGVGMLLYLVKHSRPDLSNAVRELTKVLDKATVVHWKAMLRAIKYVFDTRGYALKLQPSIRKDLKYDLEAYSDSEFAGDPETRMSVYGYVTFYCGAPISWKSKSNRCVTLSSTEAEYYAASEAAKELLFISNLITNIDEKLLHFPMTLRMDNTGAIYIANNQTTGPRTKHIDIRTHFVRNMITDGKVKTVFVKSEDNTSDIFTKNTSETIFIEHSDKLLTDLDLNENNKEK